MNKSEARQRAARGLTVAEAQAIMEPWRGKCAGVSVVNPQFTQEQVFAILWPDEADYYQAGETRLSLPAATNVLREFG